MRSARWIRRAVAAAVVLGTASVVIAASGINLSVQPSVIEVHLSLSSPGSNAGTLTNTGDTSAIVMAISPDASCSALGVNGFASPTTAFTIAGFNATHTVGIGCTASASYGIRRCQQHVTGTGGQTYTNYTGLCITEGSTMFMPSKAGVNFPNTQVGQTSAPQVVMITNPVGNPQSSMVSIQIGDQDGNFAVGAPCLANGPGCDAAIVVAPGGTFSVSLTCSPQTVGLHTAPLHIVGNAGTKLMPPILLNCTGTQVASDPAMSVNPASVSLSQPISMGALPTTVHVSNIGGADLHISSIVPTGQADWTYSITGNCSTGSCTVMPNDGGFDIMTAFTPAAIGTRDKILTITSDDPNDPMYQLVLHGTGQAATLALSTNLGTPAMLDLGTSPIGITTTATFDLRNDGNLALDPVNLTISQTGSQLGVTPAPTMIGAAGMRQITVSCTPTAADVYVGTLDISAPTAFTGSPISIAVRCTGTAGSLFAMPSTIQLGEIRTGSPLVTRTIALKTAGAPLTITANPALVSAVPGMSVGVPSSSSITMATPSTFDLTVNATLDHDLDGTIEVTAGDTLQIPVTGKVVTAAIDYPPSLMVGSFCVGQPTTGVTARLTASGTATIGLGTQPVMNKMAASPFQLNYSAPVSYPYQLPAGQTAMLEVTPLRQTLMGTQTDDLVWATDLAGQPAPHTIVTAQFIGDGGAIAPQLADFGTVMLRKPGEPKLIKIQNCGTDAITLAGPYIDPGTDFRDDSSQPLPQTLAPNQVATINVNFVPSKIGTRMARLTVDSSKGKLGVDLLGTGVADPTTTVDPKSFYACDCRTTEPQHAWPAVIVVLLLRRRRRR